MLTKESPETFYIGKLVLATVVGEWSEGRLLSCALLWPAGRRKMVENSTSLNKLKRMTMWYLSSGIQHRKPQHDQLDQANPVRNDETGLWQCPFCLKNDFPELSEVGALYFACSVNFKCCVFYLSELSQAEPQRTEAWHLTQRRQA